MANRTSAARLPETNLQVPSRSGLIMHETNKGEDLENEENREVAKKGAKWQRQEDNDEPRRILSLKNNNKNIENWSSITAKSINTPQALLSSGDRITAFYIPYASPEASFNHTVSDSSSTTEQECKVCGNNKIICGITCGSPTCNRLGLRRIQAGKHKCLGCMDVLETSNANMETQLTCGSRSCIDSTFRTIAAKLASSSNFITASVLLLCDDNLHMLQHLKANIPTDEVVEKINQTRRLLDRCHFENEYHQLHLYKAELNSISKNFLCHFQKHGCLPPVNDKDSTIDPIKELEELRRADVTTYENDKLELEKLRQADLAKYENEKLELEKLRQADLAKYENEKLEYEKLRQADLAKYENEIFEIEELRQAVRLKFENEAQNKLERLTKELDATKKENRKIKWQIARAFCPTTRRCTSETENEALRNAVEKEGTLRQKFESENKVLQKGIDDASNIIHHYRNILKVSEEETRKLRYKLFRNPSLAAEPRVVWSPLAPRQLANDPRFVWDGPIRRFPFQSSISEIQASVQNGSLIQIKTASFANKNPNYGKTRQNQIDVTERSEPTRDYYVRPQQSKDAFGLLQILLNAAASLSPEEGVSESLILLSEVAACLTPIPPLQSINATKMSELVEITANGRHRERNEPAVLCAQDAIEAAASRIQASIRGAIHRKIYQRKRDSACRIQALIRERHQSQQASASRIRQGSEHRQKYHSQPHLHNHHRFYPEFFESITQQLDDTDLLDIQLCVLSRTTWGLR